MKSESDEDDYITNVGTHKPGSIIRIELRNFLTHGHAVIIPGPRLNIVVGANGTGKSTILNAICLGLGGDPKLLGRADDLREFIMHDQDEAEIQIDLQSHQENGRHTIKRVIERNKGSERGRGRGASTFYINGTKSTPQEVRDIVCNEFGIAIDNLCTFLPQDKVGNFSGFSDQCRLLETEKTLSKDSHHYEIHQALIAEESDMEKSVVDVDSIQANMNKLQYEFERLEREKELAEERQRAIQQAELLKMKRLWLEFEQLREDALKMKDEKDKVKELLKSAKQEIFPLEEKYNNIASLKTEMEAKHKSVDQSTQRCMAEMEKQETKFERHDDEIEVIIAKLSEIDSKRAKLEVHLRESQKRLEQLEEEWNSLPPKEQSIEEHDDAVQRMRDIKKDYESAKRDDRLIKSQFKELEEKAHSLQNKLSKMNDDVARRREKIFREKHSLGVIFDWLSKHRSNFRKPVSGPIAAEITTKSQNAASYLEFHVSNHVLCSFVVETKEDYNLLYDSVRNELKVPINILLVRMKPIHRPYSEDKMQLLRKKFGVEGYLDETFTAPDPVMQALRDYSSVHKVLVGGEETQICIDEKRLLNFLSEPDKSMNQQTLQASCIFAAKGERSFRYTQTISRYSKQLGSRIDEVAPAKLLAKGVDPETKTKAEDELSAIHKEISELRPNMMKSEKIAADLESDLQQANLKAKATKLALEGWAKFESKLSRQRAKVEEAQSELEADDTKEKKNLVQSLMGRLTHVISAMEVHAEQHKQMMKLTIASAGVTINKTTLAAAERSARIELTEKKQSFSDLEKEASRIQQLFQAMKQKVAAKKKEAESAAPIEDCDGNDLPLKETLTKLEVYNLTEVDAALEDLERSIEGIHDNPDAFRQYEKLKHEIDELKVTLEEVKSSRETKVSKLQKMREPWEKALDHYVTEINSRFTNYMAEMGCTGEVRLKKGYIGDNEKNLGNFKDWGIEILVSFREGAKAQVLSAERHSGGERSVSTIMYLMALQDLMFAPFRCVDEINQGLDDRNERLVFKRIVRNSTRKPEGDLTDHSGQYFLITPKLLPNLTDMEEDAVTILFVFNGIYNFKSPTECNFASLPIVQRKRSSSRASSNSTKTSSKKQKKTY